MCGIAGFFQSPPHSSPQELQEIALRMAGTLRHRGPDDGGVWVDADAGIALGMRRLAILDLSEAGHQPMHSPSGRYLIVYNGEIYNCEEVRRDLQREDPNLRFRGHSDTEVMLAAFERWGILESLRRFNGMFAFGLWDRETRALTLARDRFGEKPLYYSIVGGRLLFGSELKALRAHPEFSAEIDRDSLALYLRHNCVPAPYSIYAGVRKLPPASLLTISAARFEPRPSRTGPFVRLPKRASPMHSPAPSKKRSKSWIACCRMRSSYACTPTFRWELFCREELTRRRWSL